MARTSAPFLLSCLCLLAAGRLHAQSAEGEFELKDGRRVPAQYVKVVPGGFAANVPVADTYQAYNFKADEVMEVSTPEPAELVSARNLVACGKYQEAIATIAKAQPGLAPYMQLPGAWYARSVIIHMDAVSAMGKGSEAEAVGALAMESKLPQNEARLIRDFQSVVAPAASGPDKKIEALSELSKSTNDPWLAARCWLEVGAVLQGQGKTEDAVKAWLRAPVFHPAERDLAARGTILATRGLQQIERPEDGLKLIEYYLADNPVSPFKEAMQTEATKLDPKLLKKDNKPDAKPPPTEPKPESETSGNPP